jgi:protein involved in polysaccharide export with SLBB domain
MKNIKIIIALIMCVLIAGTNAQSLNPGDGLRITIFNISEDISGDYYIQQDGRLQLPFLGSLNTNEKQFTDLHNEVLAKYDSLYRNPEITVQPLYRINVLGEVRNPGQYYVTGVEKLSNVLAMAGGETTDANLDDIYIVRNDEKLEVNVKDILSRGETINDIGLQSGDRVYVPREWWVGARNTTFLISGVAVLVTIVSLFVR